jgi:hypothetical protein
VYVEDELRPKAYRPIAALLKRPKECRLETSVTPESSFFGNERSNWMHTAQGIQQKAKRVP